MILDKNFIYKIISINFFIIFFDVHEEIMLKVNNPKSLFPFEIKGHYNEKGYKIISEKIIDKFL